MSDDVTTTDVHVESGPEPKTYSEDYVTKLRNEAAKYRTEKNAAVDAARQSTTEAVSHQFQSKLDGLTADLGDSWVYAQKLHSAIESLHPDSKALDFAAILQGSDPDSIRSAADKAKALFGVTAKVTATDTTQGSSGAVPPLNGDPLLAKLRSIVGPPRS
jgi:hypothetical protein